MADGNDRLHTLNRATGAGRSCGGCIQALRKMLEEYSERTSAPTPKEFSHAATQSSHNRVA